MNDKYEEIYYRSLHDPDEFWGAAAEDIVWEKRWDTVLDAENPPFYRWFKGGILNTCYNAVDRHVDDGYGDQDAIIYDSPATGGNKRKITYRELQDQVARLAGAIRNLGVNKGDTVIIYMPMIPEAVMAMLACARIGAIHSVVFGGFAPKELAERINDCKPQLILSASCGVEPNRTIDYKAMLDGALGVAVHKVPACMILQREQQYSALVTSRDHDWAETTAAAPAGGALCDG